MSRKLSNNPLKAFPNTFTEIILGLLIKKTRTSPPMLPLSRVTGDNAADSDSWNTQNEYFLLQSQQENLKAWSVISLWYFRTARINWRQPIKISTQWYGLYCCSSRSKVELIHRQTWSWTLQIARGSLWSPQNNSSIATTTCYCLSWIICEERERYIFSRLHRSDTTSNQNRQNYTWWQSAIHSFEGRDNFIGTYWGSQEKNQKMIAYNKKNISLVCRNSLLFVIDY